MEDAPERRNETEICTSTRAEIVQACSPIDLRLALIAQREKHGADSPIGHRITNLIGQIMILQSGSPAQQAALKRLMPKAIAELVELTGSA